MIVPKVRSWVGTYAVYRGNCYSCPKKKSDYWDEYAHVTGTRDEYGLHVTVAFVDSMGNGCLKRSTFEGELPAGWFPCDKEEFDREVARVLRRLGIRA